MEEYLNFLERKNIDSFDKLCDVLCFSPYNFNLIKKHKWKMFTKTEFTNIDDKQKRFLDKIVFDNDGNINKPLFINKKLIKKTCSLIKSDFPVSIENQIVYFGGKSVLIKLFEYEGKWYIVEDDYLRDVTYINSKFNLFKIFEDCCKQNKFNYKNELDKKYVYYFFITDRRVNHLHRSFTSALQLFKVFDRKTFLEIKLDIDLSCPSVLQTVIPTKYQFSRLIHFPNHIGTYIIEKDNELHVCYTCFYEDLLILNDLYYIKNIFTRFIVLKKNKKLEEFNKYFFYDSEKMRNLNNAFNTIVNILYESYYEIYVNGREDINNNNQNIVREILFEINLLYLQTNIPISKNIIEMCLLFLTHKYILTTLLKRHI